VEELSKQLEDAQKANEGLNLQLSEASKSNAVPAVSKFQNNI
jgi:hypothetical protein